MKQKENSPGNDKDSGRRSLLAVSLLAAVLWTLLVLLDRQPAPERPEEPARPTHRIGEIIEKAISPRAPGPGETPGEEPPGWRFGTPENPVAAIVIDDFGYRAATDTALLARNLPITPAVLPNLPHSRTIADAAREMGYEVILHLPMEPFPGARAEPDSIGPGMTPGETREAIGRALESVGTVVGVNNHMGSLATADLALMQEVLLEIESRGLFFLDSLTTGDSKAGEAAESLGLTILRRDIFLDNFREPDYIKGQIDRLIAVARRRGRAIGIGHVYPETFDALEEKMPDFIEAGIAIMPLSALIETGVSRPGPRAEPPREGSGTP